jgi:TP901 family phage tail tape measure protein
MAKSVKNTISIYVDGKEVENSVKAIQAAMRKLVNEMNNAEIGSEKYVTAAKKIQILKGIIEEQNAEFQKTIGIIDSLKKKLGEWAGAFQSVFFVKKGIDWAQEKMQQYVDEFSKIDKAMAATQRASGLTREEIEELNKEFKKIDTTTPVEQLHNLAAIGAKLGYNTKKDIAEFTDAADKLRVVFGEDFDIAGATKLIKVFGEDDTLGIRGALMATGSTLGKLSKQTGQTAGDLLEFTNKVAVLGQQAGFTQAEIMGFGATLMANLQDAGLSANAFNKLISKVYTDSSKFAKAAGVDVAEFAKAVKEDANKALLDLLETMNSAGSLDKLMPIFKELGLGGKTASVMTAIATNIDEIRKNQELANKTYEEGTGIINSFNITNETAAAKLEKAKNAIVEAKQELGENLMPIMTKLTEGTAGFTKGLAELTKWAIENRGSILALAGAYSIVWAIKNRTAIADAAVLAFKKAEAVVDKIKHTSLLYEISIRRKVLASELQEIAAKEASTLAKMRNRLETLSGIAADRQLTAVLAQETIVQNANTVATQAATKATQAQKAAFASTPWGAIIMAITAIGVGIYQMATYMTTAKKAMKEFREESAKEEAQAKYLFDALQKAEKGTDEYKKQLERLKELYPDIISAHINERGELENLKIAYNNVTAALKSKIAEQMKEKALTKAIEDNINEQKKAIDNLTLAFNMIGVKESRKQTMINEVIKEIEELANKGKNLDEILKIVKISLKDTEFHKISGIRQHIAVDNMVSAINRLSESAVNLRNTKNDLDKTFNPIIAPKAQIDVKELNTQLQSLDTQLKNLGKKHEIIELQKELALLNKEFTEQIFLTNLLGGVNEKRMNEIKKKMDEIQNRIKEFNKTTTPPGDPKEDKSAIKWKELNDKILKLQEERREKLLDGFEKERQQITFKYDEMIKDVKEFGEKNKKYAEEAKVLAEKLETEKGEAVLQAAHKYFEKYAEVAKKFQEEITKLAEKTTPSASESKLINDLLGSEKEWNDKIRSMSIHFKELREMQKNASTDSEKESIAAKMNELDAAWLNAIEKREQAKVNIIKKYTQETSKFVEDSADKQYLASLSSKEKEKELLKRQKAEIKKRYDEEIARTQELIAAKKKLETTTEEEIKKLEDLIAELEKLKKNSDIEITIETKNKDIGNIFQQIIDIDWDNFGDNLEENIGKIASGLQVMADTISSIWNDINKIAIANLQKELDTFKKTKDQELKIFNNQQKSEKKGLDDKLKTGIISQEYYNAQLEKMEEEKTAKEEKIAAEKEAKELEFKKRQFEIERKAAIVQAFINGALAVTMAWVQGGPIGGPIMAILVGLMTAAQIAVIASQPEPYRFGGFTGNKKKKIIQVNEDGQEWIASNRLLQDKKTAPIIGALDQYQQGNRSLLDNMYVSTPNQNNLSQAASSINNNFTSTKSEKIIEKHYVTSETQNQNNDDMIAVINKLYYFLENNKTLTAIFNRQLFLDYEKNENFLKNKARINGSNNS